MLETPDLSIIVPIFKAEEYLPECLNSILKQTLTNFELILINDGSPDKSDEICRKYAEKDERIKIIHKSHGGASSARNAGAKAANGKYIGWVDADDQISPQMYETLFNLAESYQAEIADCQYYMVDGDKIVRSGSEEPVVYGEGDFILEEFFKARMKPGLTTKIYRRDLWNGLVFPEGRKHQDYYINVRFALMPIRYVRTPEPMYYYIKREKSITTTYTSYEIREAVYLYEYTMKLADSVSNNNQVKNLLVQDAINRLMNRYCDVSVNSCIDKQHVYNYLLMKKLKFKLIKFLIFGDLPLKTKVSYALVLLNMKKLQHHLHKSLGKNDGPNAISA